MKPSRPIIDAYQDMGGISQTVEKQYVRIPRRDVRVAKSIEMTGVK